jgi:hypothetical protein
MSADAGTTVNRERTEDEDDLSRIRHSSRPNLVRFDRDGHRN